MKKVGIIGSGAVAQVLGSGFLKHGYAVMIGSRNKEKLNDWKNASGRHASTGSVEEAAAFGALLVLCVKGSAAETVVKMIAEHAKGKTIIDTTNPIADAPPVNGVIQYFTQNNESLMERLQLLAPECRFVKAFNSVGNAFMVNPTFPAGKPTMFICGNDDESKAEVTEVLSVFGWDTEDMGKMESARPIESLCILWCIPGFIRNEWMHAFKLLKMKM